MSSSNNDENLFTLLKKNKTEKLFQILNKDKSNINILNKEGLSLLHISIIKGNIEIINKLLSLGADPNILSLNKKQTPLHFAYIYKKEKSKEIIKKLKEFKAKENILDIYSKKPIDYLIKETKEIKEKNNNGSKRIKKIENKVQGDIDICESNEEEEELKSLEDSLEKTNKNNNIKEIKSRNDLNIIKKPNKIPVFRYPNLFNNIISNNLMNNTYNKINKTEDQIFLEILSKKRSSLNIRNSNLKDNNQNNTTGFKSSLYSTEDRTKSRNNYEKEKEKVSLITNNEVVEFNYEDTITKREKDSNIIINNINTVNYSTVNNNTSFNVLNKETVDENILFTRKYTNKPTININVNKDLKYWLDNLNLSQYLDNFIQNDIFDINILINQMKSADTKLNYDDIESILKIHKPGHIYRIFSALEISAGLIESKVSDFLIKKNIKNTLNKSKNNLKLSVSREINSCVNCFRINFLFTQKKNDLNNFLTRYDLNNFYQNFYHNGFDNMNYVMAQMFSSEPIDEIILENCFHIYETQDTEKVLKCLMNEKNKINYFLNSKEYLQFNSKHNIKYEDIIFEKKESDNSQNEKIIIPKNASCLDCAIF